MFESKACAACAAKSDEIKHLLASLDQRAKENELLQKRLIELAAPGTNRRLMTPRVLEKDEKVSAAPFVGPRVPNFPGYERAPAKPGYEVE